MFIYLLFYIYIYLRTIHWNEMPWLLKCLESLFAFGKFRREVWLPLLAETTRRWNILSLKLRASTCREKAAVGHGLDILISLVFFSKKEWKRSENVDWFGWFGWFSYTEVDEILELKSLIFPT